MPDILSSLNPAQKQAVTLNNEHALILAGAGSGKTKVLTTRIAWLINQNLASAYNILAVTFTNKAAKEMQHRLSHMLDFNSKAMFIGTFHSLCHRILRIHASSAGLSNDFQIIDMADQLSFIKKLLKQHNINEDEIEAKTLANFINQAKERGERSFNAPISQDKFGGKLINLYKFYEEATQKENILDFSELLLRCDELLENNQNLREHYQQRFKYVLIDEFQDTNSLQYAWLKKFRGTENTFFAVGDDDQSIYSFRGARVKNMHDYEIEFNVKYLIKLEQNYRSQQYILHCANTIISNNSTRLGKNLFTVKTDGEKVKVYVAPNDTLEAGWIGQHITSLVDNGSKLNEIAILYRSNAQSRIFEHVLFKEHIPYKVYGGLRFFDRAEIKHALAYLQLIDNLEQNLAMLRVINFPPRGIGAKSIENLQDIATNLDVSLSQAYMHLPPKASNNIHNFINLIKDMQFKAQSLNLIDAIEYMLDKSGLLDYYSNEKEGEDRINNLKELMSAAHSFYTEEKISLTTSCLDKISYNTDEFNATENSITPLRLFLSYAMLDNSSTDNASAVQLMTIHASKGMEFEHVFISGVESNLFPNSNNSYGDNLEEERRLMYVAITRARYNLFITAAQSRMLYGKTSFNKYSQFINELPDDSIKWLSPKPNHNLRSNGQYERNNYNDDESNQNYKHNNYTNYYEYKQHTQYKNDSNEANEFANKIANKVNLNNPFKVGVKVISPKFGDGVIKSIQGNGDETLVNIKFNKYGDKILNLAMANLQISQ